MHVRTELSCFDNGNFLFALRDDVLVKFVSESRVAGTVERRAVALIAIGIKRELRDEQQRAAHVFDREVRFSIFVGKDAERKHFLDEAVGNFAGIALAYSD